MAETTTTKPSQGRRKERVGVVVASKMDKTIVVRVERRVRHPRFEKVITKTAKFYAHDADKKAGHGDVVLIRETRPLSKLKRWELVGILEKGSAKETVE